MLVVFNVIIPLIFSFGVFVGLDNKTKLAFLQATQPYGRWFLMYAFVLFTLTAVHLLFTRLQVIEGVPFAEEKLSRLWIELLASGVVLVLAFLFARYCFLAQGG